MGDQRMQRRASSERQAGPLGERSANRRVSPAATERAAEQLADAILARLYPATTPIEKAAERTRWIWIRGRRVPRNTGEDLFGCLDRLVIRPDGTWHGIQITTAAAASARKAKVIERLIVPLERARSAAESTSRGGGKPMSTPLVDVWAATMTPGLQPGMRAWRWDFASARWVEVTDALGVAPNLISVIVAAARSSRSRSGSARRSPLG